MFGDIYLTYREHIFGVKYKYYKIMQMPITFTAIYVDFKGLCPLYSDQLILLLKGAIMYWVTYIKASLINRESDVHTKAFQQRLQQCDVPLIDR